MLQIFDVAMIAMGGAAVICVCCVIAEIRLCARLSAEDERARRNMKYTGIQSGGSREPIELIGSRPASERPPGVGASAQNLLPCNTCTAHYGLIQTSLR